MKAIYNGGSPKVAQIDDEGALLVCLCEGCQGAYSLKELHERYPSLKISVRNDQIKPESKEDQNG
jgi:hypothetical protein